MAGHLPDTILVCFLTLFLGANGRKNDLRGSHALNHVVHELLHHHALPGSVNEGHRHQAGEMLAVTDDAVDTAWKDQMHIPKPTDYDMCMGSRYMWMAKMMTTCKNMFGPQSYWDRERRPFCTSGFEQCRPYYAQCCTQPEGATSLKVYCNIRAEQKHSQQDPACIVQATIKTVEESMAKIPDVANRILLSKPRMLKSSGDDWDYREESTASSVADESYHDKLDGDADIADAATTPNADARTALVQGAGGAGPGSMRVTSAPPQVEAEGAGPQGESRRTQPEKWELMFAPPTREVHCSELSHVLVGMNEALSQLTVWRTSNNGNEYDPESMANQDPELLRYVDDLVAAGRMLKRRADACTSSLHEEEAEDIEEQTFLQSPVGADQSIVLEELSMSSWSPDEMLERKLRSRMNGYMGFVGYMNLHVSSIESKIHPHGDKWWRHRYEQTIMEAFFHIPMFVALICLQHFMSCVAAEIDAASDSGQRSRIRVSNFYRHLNISCMHNSVAIALIMFCLWSVHAHTPIFDRFAIEVRSMWEACIDNTPDHCIFESVPFSGNAYYTMSTDIAMNLLGACMLYSVCVWEFLRISIRFLERLKASEQSPSSEDLPPAEVQELEQYLAFQEFFCDRLAKMQKSDRVKSSAKAIGLDLDRNLTQDDLKKVKFHRYLVVSLDRASRDFVQWSPALLLTLIVWSVLVAVIASWKKLSFAWFLPGILLTLLVLLVLAHLLKRALWASTIKEQGEASMPWLSANRWITAVQVALFMLCYCFTRFMFSKSIWMEYPWLAFYVLVGFATLIILTRVCISDIMMRMVCVLSLPPNASTEVLEDYLEQMSDVVVDGKAEF